jgi:hypothetical protein
MPSEHHEKRFQAVYAVVPKSDGKDLFLRVGSAFPNRDGSLTLLLDAVPISGKLHVRDYQPRQSGAHAFEPTPARAAV